MAGELKFMSQADYVLLHLGMKAVGLGSGVGSAPGTLVGAMSLGSAPKPSARVAG